MILLEHPEHGRTHVYNDVELEYHLSEGWKPLEEKKEESTQIINQRGRPKGFKLHKKDK